MLLAPLGLELLDPLGQIRERLANGVGQLAVLEHGVLVWRDSLESV